MPTIDSQFPVVFENNAEWQEFDGECFCCGKTLDRANVTGLVSQLTPSVVTVEATGVCTECKLVTRFDYRLHDDMRVTGRREDGWKTWEAAPTIWDRLVSMFKFRPSA